MGKTRDLFKNIRDTKGTFHAKMGSIKDRNGLDLTEAEYIRKRWQEYTEELYKKDLHDPDNHDGVITNLEPDILECEVTWALESITMNCYAPSPYLQTNRESEQVHHGNAKARREFFISSALGLKPHRTQRNQTRAPNKAVWRFIYSQLFVSVTGYLAILDWTGRMSSCNAFLMLSHIEIFPYLVKECSSRKQET